MADWVLAAERAYVAAAVGPTAGAAATAVAGSSPAGVAGSSPAGVAGSSPADAGKNATAPGPRLLLRSDWAADLPAADRRVHAIAAAGAVASRYLAVGTPRSFGIVIDDVADADAAALSLTAHRTWFAPRDIRCASIGATAPGGAGAAELAAATSGRVVSLDEALACDIVNVYSSGVRIAPTQLRRGTHVNALTAGTLDPELLALATVVPEAGLPALAAGLVDGRQLDELTLFIISDAPSPHEAGNDRHRSGSMTTSIEMPALDSVEAEGQKSPALDSLEVEGYKSIRSAKIDLGAINVLIGANGSGKSNLIGLFGLLADLADHRLQLHVARQGGADALLHFGRKKTSALRLLLRLGLLEYRAVLIPSAGDTLVFDHETPSSREVPPFEVPGRRSGQPMAEYMGSPGSKETGLGAGEKFLGSKSFITEPLIAAMKSWRPFHFHDTGTAAPAKQKHKIDDNRALRPEGDNLAPFLFALRSIAPGAYRRIVESVRSVAPFFDDFVLEPDVINPGVIQLAWRHTMDDALFTADSLSDGTLRFICLATLLLQPTLPSLIVIDEPELGLHPFAIAQLAALVRAAATKTQVILATQSVTLLDQFDAGEVIVADRSNGESTFRRLDESALAEWKQEYSLGELWLKNVLGGRPR